MRVSYQDRDQRKEIKPRRFFAVLLSKSLYSDFSPVTESRDAELFKFPQSDVKIQISSD